MFSILYGILVLELLITSRLVSLPIFRETGSARVAGAIETWDETSFLEVRVSWYTVLT